MEKSDNISVLFLSLILFLLFACIDVEVFSSEEKPLVRLYSAHLMSFYPHLSLTLTTKMTLVLLMSFRDMFVIKLENDDGGDESMLIVDKMVKVGVALEISSETLLLWSDKCKQSFRRRNAAYVHLDDTDDFVVPCSTITEQFKTTTAMLASVTEAVHNLQDCVGTFKDAIGEKLNLLSNKVDELQADVESLKRNRDDTSHFDSSSSMITPAVVKRRVSRTPSNSSLLFGMDSGKTLGTVFYNWYVDELWNDIEPQNTVEARKVQYEAASKQKKFARTVKLMHLLSTAATTIQAKP